MSIITTSAIHTTPPWQADPDVKSSTDWPDVPGGTLIVQYYPEEQLFAGYLSSIADDSPVGEVHSAVG